MYVRLFSLLIALGSVAIVAASAGAGTIPSDGPVRATELILEYVPAGEGFTKVYDNVFDLDHPKLLLFHGVFANLSDHDSEGRFFFDWLDPATREPQFSPAVSILVPAHSVVAYGLHGERPIRFEIPFCPPKVSIHYENGGPGGPVKVLGAFTHICRIPEPSSLLLAGFGLAGVGVVALRRRT